MNLNTFWITFGDPAKTLSNPFRRVDDLNCGTTQYIRFIHSCFIRDARIAYHMEQNDLISELQFGFRKNRSTIDATEVEENKTKRNPTCLIALDKSNAFNTVNWSILINKLQKYNIPKYLIEMVSSFLNNRKITIDDVTTDYGTGVPQGSSMGPLLWNIYMNDIFELEFAGEVKIQAFADDLILNLSTTAAYRFESTAKTALDLIFDWATKNKLKFNYSKSNYIIITYGKQVSRKPPIRMANNKIEYTKELKYLGVVFDE